MLMTVAVRRDEETITQYGYQGAAAYERRSLAIASHWPFDQWGHFLPAQATAVALLDRLLHHAVA